MPSAKMVIKFVVCTGYLKSYIQIWSAISGSEVQCSSGGGGGGRCWEGGGFRERGTELQCPIASEVASHNPQLDRTRTKPW